MLIVQPVFMEAGGGGGSRHQHPNSWHVSQSRKAIDTYISTGIGGRKFWKTHSMQNANPHLSGPLWGASSAPARPRWPRAHGIASGMQGIKVSFFFFFLWPFFLFGGGGGACRFSVFP